MNITTIGMDLAKNSFSVHGINEHDIACLKKTVSRKKLLSTLATHLLNYSLALPIQLLRKVKQIETK